MTNNVHTNVPQGAEFLTDPPLNLTQRKGRYGVTYLRALSNQAGCTFNETESGEDVQSIDSRIGFTSGDVYVQVKATKRYKLSGNNGSLTYKPEENWLRKWQKIKVPIYFVVVVVPEKSDQWLVHSETGTEMQQTAAYWCRINVEEVRAINKITVPRSQRLSALTFHSWELDLEFCFGGDPI